ncbi:MAG: tRNA (N6-isopentenyl adenosine(37)-C2)-methylthiotransferase MiaB [Pseudomonadota bacterium]
MKTMGCQMNEYDSDFLAQSLILYGLFPVDDPRDADVVLINTCMVRAKPEHKALSLLGRMSSIKERRPHMVLGVVGCLAQRDGAGLLERFPQLDLVMGPRELSGIQEALGRIHSSRERVVATKLESGPPRAIHTTGYFEGRVTAHLSIMEGCNNFCSYCIVPYARGREVSRSPGAIFEEAKALVSEGVRDITLLGQNVNSYLWEEGRRWTFPSLLHEISKLEGLWRLRFTTSHPKDLSDELIRCYGEVPRLCPHLHLPFQAGSNRILELMKRGYTRERYLGLIAKLRAVRPDISITSDVMVGFPGETGEDFQLTLDLIREVEFDSLFSFKYSDRKGTMAERMPDKIDETEKASRLSILQTLQKEISLRKNKELEGKKVEILVEGQSKKVGMLMGRTPSNKIVNFECNNGKLGYLVEVIVKDGLLNSLRGEAIENGWR